MTDQSKERPWTLSSDGGSRERLWTEEIFGGDDGYERLWRGHIVPLTFRSLDRKNRYIRPSANSRLLALADSTYATLFHLTECHAWAHRMREILETLKGEPEGGGSPGSVVARKRQILPTEALYCFFSHGYSLLESSVKFGEAVNWALGHYRSPAVQLFTFKAPSSESGSKRLETWNDPKSEKSYAELSSSLRGYRAALVHDKPVFILTGRIPRSKGIDQWSGLAAICLAVNDQKRYATETVRVGDAFDELLALMRESCRGMWGAAATAMAPLLKDERYLKAQREGIDKDKDLTGNRINRFIALTRLG